MWSVSLQPIYIFIYRQRKELRRSSWKINIFRSTNAPWYEPRGERAQRKPILWISNPFLSDLMDFEVCFQNFRACWIFGSQLWSGTAEVGEVRHKDDLWQHTFQSCMHEKKQLSGCNKGAAERIWDQRTSVWYLVTLCLKCTALKPPY